MLTKLTVQAREGSVDQAVTVGKLLLTAGELIRTGEEGHLVHYTERPEMAREGWNLWGFDVVACEEVALGPEGLTGLLADLTKESDASE